MKGDCRVEFRCHAFPMNSTSNTRTEFGGMIQDPAVIKPNTNKNHYQDQLLQNYNTQNSKLQVYLLCTQHLLRHTQVPEEALAPASLLHNQITVQTYKPTSLTQISFQFQSYYSTSKLHTWKHCRNSTAPKNTFIPTFYNLNILHQSLLFQFQSYDSTSKLHTSPTPTRKVNGFPLL